MLFPAFFALVFFLWYSMIFDSVCVVHVLRVVFVLANFSVKLLYDMGTILLRSSEKNRFLSNESRI